VTAVIRCYATVNLIICNQRLYVLGVKSNIEINVDGRCVNFWQQMTEIGRLGGRKEGGTSLGVYSCFVLALEKAMLYCAEADQLQQAPISATSTSIPNAGASRICSVLLGLHVPADGLLSDMDDGEGMLFSPLSFLPASDGVAGQLHHPLLLSVLTDTATVTWLCSTSLESG